MDHVYQKISKKLNDNGDQKLEIDRTELQEWASTLIDIETLDLESIFKWCGADNPPKGNKDKWSRAVIAVTNFGNAYTLCYYHGMSGGNWQRRVEFEENEKVVKWADFPNT